MAARRHLREEQEQLGEEAVLVFVAAERAPFRSEGRPPRPGWHVGSWQS
jgi:hypothetical protein